MAHPLHKALGDKLRASGIPGLVLDEACGGNQRIPLFGSHEKARKTEYCNVDAMIVNEDGIRVIIEIEEANIRPTHICGKILTSAFASCYMHEKERLNRTPMADSVLFIQVVDVSKLPNRGSSKRAQLGNLADSISRILPLKRSTIDDYKLLTVAGPNDQKGLDEVVRVVEEATARKPSETGAPA